AVLVVWFGRGGFVAAFFFAVLPYAFDQGHTVGNFLVLTGAIAYLGSSFLHNALYDPGASLTNAGLDTLVFILVAMALKRIPATLIARIRHARSVMGEAERGYLAVRAPAGESAELGFLERSFNRMIEEIGVDAQTIGRIARRTHLLALNAAIEAARAEETGEGFAVVADEVRALAAEAGKSAREVAELVSELRAGIDAAARAMQSGETKV